MATEITETETFKRFMADAEAACHALGRESALYDPTHTYLSVMAGPKYLRIVKADGSSRYAWAFIDRATGDILKPDGWKRPAKHARGNIFNHDTVGAYGPPYLR